MTTQSAINQATATSASRLAKAAPGWELAILIAVYLVVHFLVPAFEQIYVLAVVVYLIVEAILRHRTWADNGFGLRNIFSGLLKTWGWALLVAFGMQALVILAEHFLLPDVYAHIIARTSKTVDLTVLKPSLFIILAIGTFEEEFLYRAVFQNRLSAFTSSAVAIVGVSLLFALAHFHSSPALVVVVDLFSIFVDSLIYGLIFRRSRNIFVSWLPHYVADLFAVILMMLVK
jgi:uncharacterized protein